MSGAEQEASRELALCERFLDSAQKGTDGPEFRAALAALYPLVVRTVERIFGTWKGLSPGLLDAGDVAHEVILRLQKSPPNRNPGCNARFTVLKWIHTSTVNYLTDLSRKAFYKNVRTDPEQLANIVDDHRDTHLSDLGGSGDPEQSIYEHQHLAALESYLRVHYPLGARYLVAYLNHPDATTEELARVLGTTKQNVYQIMTRLKRWAVKWRNGISSY